MSLDLFVLGSFQARVAGQPVTHFESDKARALLVYLAVEHSFPHPRDTLIELLWPDLTLKAARHNLSQVLSSLRKTLGEKDVVEPYLLADRNNVQINPAAELQLDATKFGQLLGQCHTHQHARPALCANCAEWRQQAVALYRGDLLIGLAVAAGSMYDDWVTLQRERHHRQAIEALFWLTHYHASRGELAAAEQYARRQVALEPWREEAHRQLMRVLAHSGQRSAALAQYQACAQVMEAELGVAPSAETTILYDRIRTAPTTQVHNLPAYSSPFVGRKAEIADISAQLADPTCRILSVTGQGGVGKTRVATQVGQQVQQRYLNGVWFVPLASIATGASADDAASALLTAIAGVLGFVFQGRRPPVEQLSHYLHDRELLLILDNFEHLQLSATVLTRLVDAVLQLDILVTSREQLRLASTWAQPLRGLDLPSDDSAESIQFSAAAQLFVAGVQRVRGELPTNASDAAAIGRICQLVEGLPLALELAATWARVISLQEIVAEIEQGLGIFEAHASDVPERHRSMRAVITYSWTLLSAETQTVLAQLALFRGSFSREAATQVAHATLPILAELIDKSLLRREADGRYSLHELLRQFAAEKLQKSADTAAYDRIIDYYADWLATRSTHFYASERTATLADIDLERDTVRSVWQLMLGANRYDALDQILQPLFLYYDLGNRLADGNALFSEAVARCHTAPTPLMIRLLVRLGRLCERLSQYDMARMYLERAIVLLRDVPDSAEWNMATHYLGIVAFRTGGMATAQSLLNSALAGYRVTNNRRSEAELLTFLSEIQRQQGDYSHARQHSEHSLALLTELADQAGIAVCLHQLGVLAVESGDDARAAAFFERCLTVETALNDRWGIAATYNSMGNLARRAGELDVAQAHLQHSLALWRDLGVPARIAATFNNLGRVAQVQDDATGAQRFYVESYMICERIGDMKGAATALTNSAELAYLRGDSFTAQRDFERSLHLFEGIGFSRGIAVCRDYLARISAETE